MIGTITHTPYKKATLLKFATITLAGLVASTLGQAATMFNGNFTSTSGTFAAAGGALNTLKSDGVTADYTGGGSLSNWTVEDVGSSTGLAELYFAGNQGSTTTNGDGVNLTSRFGNFSVYDPGNVAGATPTGGAIPNTSPGGGNFVAADGAVGYQLAIYETLTNLTPNAAYAVTFWYAAAQQYSFTGVTTEGWQVSMENAAQLTQVTANGTTIQDTPAQAGGGLAQGSFQAWAQQTFDFKAASSTQVLTFLSLGTPSGEPPVDFLSNVQLSPAPEPASLWMFGAGIVPLAGLFLMRRIRLRKIGCSL